MKHRFIFLLFLAFVPSLFGQMPSVSPTPAQSAPPEMPRTRNFGSSLKRYERKKADKTQGENNLADDVVRVSTDLVVNDVLVTNQKGNVILGLQKEDFIVTEDGAQQTVQMFAPGESATVPRSVVLIMDAGGLGPLQEKSIQAARVLVDKLGPQDKMAIVTAYDLKLRLNFTNDKTLLKRALDSLSIEWALFARRAGHSDGVTETQGVAETHKPCACVFPTLLAVLSEMFDGSERRPIIVFQSQGGQVITIKPDKDSPYHVSDSTLERTLELSRHISLPNFGFTEAKEAIEQSRATIYSVIPGIRFLGLSNEEQLARAKLQIVENNRFYDWHKESEMPDIIKYLQHTYVEVGVAGQTAMYKIAELSGGFTSFIEKPEDAESVYSDIFTVIKNRYVIGYSPTNRTRDGKLRQLTIQVRNHPEFTVTGRKAYVLQ